MQVVVTGRHVSVTDAMKAYAEEKFGKMMKFYGRVSEIRVVLGVEASKPIVECIVDVEHADDFIAHESHDDMYAAIDAVADKIERQLRKHKERLDDRHHKHPGAGDLSSQA